MPTIRGAFAGMSVGAKFVFLVPLIVISWTLLIGGPVDELPFGAQTPVNAFAYVVSQLIVVAPWLEVIYDIIIAGIQIKIMLMVVEIFKWVISVYMA